MGHLICQKILNYINDETHLSLIIKYKSYLMAFTVETKMKAIYHYGMNKSLRKTAKRFSISKSTLQRWIQICNSTRIDKMLNVKKFYKVNNQIIIAVQDAVKRFPFITLKDLQTIIRRSFNISLSHETVRRIIRSLKITRKRASIKVIKSKTYWNLLQEKRRIFMETYIPINIDTIISIDETSVCSNLFPKYGYNEKGKRLHVPLRSYKTRKINVIMAVSSRRIEHIQLSKDNTNSVVFIDFINRLILSLDNSISRVFIMDNVSFHKNKKVEHLINSYGHRLLFTPPYSPDTNPIENAFSVLKHRVRKDFGKPFLLVLLALKNIQIHQSQLTSMFIRAKRADVTSIAPELFRWIPE